MPQAQPSRGTKQRRDKVQIMTKQTPHMKLPAHRANKEEELPWNGQLLIYYELKQVYSRD